MNELLWQQLQSAQAAQEQYHTGKGSLSSGYARPTTGLTFAQAIERVLEGSVVRRAHTWRAGVVLYLNEADDLTMDIPDADPEEQHVVLDYDDLSARDWMVE